MHLSSVFKTVSFLGVALLILHPIASAERGLQRNTDNTVSLQKTPYSDGIFRAIVIGNNAYKDAERIWTPLKTAVNDAKSVANTLKQDYGFAEVAVIIDATRRDILVALTKIREQVKQQDSVLIYYAGHGYLNESTNEAFWIPVDAQGWDDSFFLSNVEIKEKLAVIASKANHTLIVSDSCFSGTLLRGNANNTTDASEPFFRKVAQRKSVQILAAGGVEFVDDDYRKSGHSPFTYFFLKVLKDNNQSLFTATSLTSNLARLVANNVQQTPQSGILHGAGDEGGEFIFSKPRVNDVKTPQPKLQTPNSVIQSLNIDPMAVELSFWTSVKDIDTPDLYLAYLEKFPTGTFAQIAKHKLNMVEPRNPEIDIVSDIIGRFKLSLEAQNNSLIEAISDFNPGRKQFIAQLFQQYKTYRVKISGFKHINNEHQASAQITIENLVDNKDRSVQPGPWSQFDILVRKNKRGDWKVVW